MNKLIVFSCIALFSTQILPSSRMIDQIPCQGVDKINLVEVSNRLHRLKDLKQHHAQEKYLEREIKSLDADISYEDFFTSYDSNNRLKILENCKQEIELRKQIKVLDPDSPYDQLVPYEAYKTLKVNRFSDNKEEINKIVNTAYNKCLVFSLNENELKCASDNHFNCIMSSLKIKGHQELRNSYKELIETVTDCDLRLKKACKYRRNLNVILFLPEQKLYESKQEIKPIPSTDKIRSSSILYAQVIQRVASKYKTA